MDRRHLRVSLATVTMVAVALVGGWGSSGVAEAASVSVSVSCNSNPERTTVHNGTGHRITVQTVGSTYHPRSNEPFGVNDSLANGHSITYQSGYAAHTHVLTHQYIYNNDERDGAKVKTSAGTFKRYCP